MKNKLKLLILGCLFFFTTVVASSAAIMTSTLEGIDSESIESFTLVFDVDNSFALNTSSFGDAIPSPINIGWNGDFTTGNNSLTISNANYDSLLGDAPNPLNNGLLFNIEYEGSITGLSDIYFFDVTGLTQNAYSVQIANINTWLADGNIQFVAGSTPVPLPPALLLLGSGLVGMISFRRKLMS